MTTPSDPHVRRPSPAPDDATSAPSAGALPAASGAGASPVAAAVDGHSETLDAAARPSTITPSGARSGAPQGTADPALAETGLPSGTRPQGESAGLVGRRIGDYELLAEIARGGMGVVYKARQHKLDRIVALKMILAGQLASTEDVERFYREARAAATLEHPGIVPVFEVNSHDDLHYYSMGYVDGASLQERIERGPLPPRDAARLMRPIAEAIHFAHQQGVVHRDLKPRNILLTRDEQPKVTDFGLAKRVDGAGELTASGAVLGTPGYMPPEQAAGRIDDVGPRADIYSLGAVLYCLLVGRAPFQGVNLVDVLRKVQEEPPVPPRKLVPGVPVDLETICLKCLEKSPTARYASAGELRDELGRFLAGDPIHARRAGLLRRGWMWARRRPLVVALGASLAALLIGGIFSAQALQRSSQARRWNEAVRLVDEALEQTTPDEAALAEFDARVAQLETLDPATAAERQERLARRLAEQIGVSLRKPKLESPDLDRLEEQIERLRPRDEELAESLSGELRNRRKEWQRIGGFARPTANESSEVALAIATPVAAKRTASDGDSQGAEPATQVWQVKSPGRVLLPIGAPGAVAAEIEFAAGWADAPRLGLLLSAADDSGYEFAIEGTMARALSEEGTNASGDREQAAEAKSAPSLATVARRGGELAAVVYRNRLPVVRRVFPASDWPLAGSLVLRATRKGSELTLQVQQLPVIEVEDPFPLRANDGGKFGLLWPSEARVARLDLFRQTAPLAASPLEQGDVAYESGRVDEALEFYRRQAVESRDGEFAKEARYKQAVCLEDLGRTKESDEAFQALLQEPGRRWPLLAGARLWVSRLRQKNRDEANVVYEQLASRFSFADVATLLPESLRREILDALMNLSVSSSAFRFDPESVKSYEQWAAVDRYLSADGRGRDWVQIELGRTLQFHGDTFGALRAMEPVTRDSRSEWILRQYSRVLRHAGRADEAEAYAIEFNRRAKGANQPLRRLAGVERAQIAAALGEWGRCEALVDEMHDEFRDAPTDVDPVLAEIALMKGLLHERRGEPSVARQTWQDAYDRLRPALLQGRLQTSTAVLVAILGSFVDGISEEESRILRTTLISSGGGSWFTRQAESVIQPQTLHVALRKAWTTPLGRRQAWAIAFDETPRRERWKIPATRTALAYLNQAAAQGEWTLEQEEVLYEHLANVFDEFLTGDKISVTQVAQLVLAWKGTTNFLGWAGVAPSLKPEVRAGFAYLFAFRALAQNNPTQAKEYFETARRDAPPDSALARLAARDAELLAAGQTLLVLESDAADAVTVELRRGEETLAKVDVRGRAEVRVPAGPVELRFIGDATDLRLGRRSIQASVAGSRAVAVESRWSASESQRGTTGILPAPAPRVISSGWQIVREFAAGDPVRITWTRQGDRCVVVGRDGAVRVHDAQTGALVRFIPRTLEHVSHARMSPTEDLLLLASSDGFVGAWDLDSGRRRFVRRPHDHFVTSLAWSADGRQFVSVAGQDDLAIGRANGQITRTLTNLPGWIAQAAIGVDERFLVALHHSNNKAVMYLVSTEDGTWRRITAPDDERPIGSIACDPQGRWIAAAAHGTQLRFWHASTGKWSAEHGTPGGWVMELRSSADGSRVRAFMQENAILDVDPFGEPGNVARRASPPAPGRSELSPDEKRWFFMTDDGRFGTADAPSGTPAFWNESRERTSAWARRPGGEPGAALAGTDGNVWMFGADDSPPRRLPHDRPEKWLELAWSPDGRSLAGTAASGRLLVWSADGMLRRHKLIGVPWHVVGLGWEGPDRLLVSSQSAHLRRYYVEEDRLEERAWKDAPPTLRAAVAANGTVAYVGERTIDVRRGGEPLQASLPREAWSDVACIAWSRGGDRLLVPATNGRVRLFSATNSGDSTPIARMSAPKAAAWSPDDSHFAIGSNSGEIRVWTAQGRLVRSLWAGAPIRALDYASPTQLEAVTEDQNWIRWDLATGRPLEVRSMVAGRWVRWTGAGKPLDLSDESAASLKWILGGEESQILDRPRFDATLPPFE